MKRQWLFECFRTRPLPVAQARRRRHGQRGVTALEFAIVGPLAIFLLFFTIEMAVLLMADALLGRVAANITRTAQLEKISSGCGAQVESMLKTGMGGWFIKDGDFIFEQVAVYNPSAGGAQGNNQNAGSTSPLLCDAAPYGGAVVFKVGFKTAGFTGAMAFFKMGSIQFSRSFLIQNGPQ